MMRRGVLLTSTCAAAATLAAGAIAYAATESQARLERLNVRETVLSAEQGRNLNRMARLLTALAQFRRDPPPALLVSPGDATDAVRAAILVKAITPELQKRAKVYAAEAGEIARQRRLAAVASEALFTSDSELAERRERLEATPPGAAPVESGPITPPIRLLAPAKGKLIQRYGAPLTGGGEASGVTFAADHGASVAST